MSETDTHERDQRSKSAPACSARHRSWLAVAVVVVATFVALALVIRHLITSAVSPAQIAEQVDSAGRLRPLADIIERTHAMKLVTVEVRSTVASVSESVIWRGRATAVIKAPVRYVYGIDLSELERSAFSLHSPTCAYTLQIPRPRRIAIEVDTANAFEERVEVSGTRTRGRAGETQLSLARKQLSEEAERQALSPEELQRVEAETLEQVRAAFRRVVGSDNVKVFYK